MSLTSERLKELTKKKLELIREIDKNQSNEGLKESLSALEMEISKERAALIGGGSSGLVERKEDDEPASEKAVSHAEHAHNADNPALKEKSLRDFF
jgi:hypothetical protein